MTTQEIKRKLTAILSADMESYTRLMAKDEAGTLQTLNTYKEAMAGFIQHHHSRGTRSVFTGKKGEDG
jgi:adenylate cyclase